MLSDEDPSDLFAHAWPGKSPEGIDTGGKSHQNINCEGESGN